MSTVLLNRGWRHIRYGGRWIPALSGVNRSVAGTIATSLAVQAALVLSGVAAARMLGVLDRGHLAMFILLSTVLPVICSLGLPLALTFWIARAPELAWGLLVRVRFAFAGLVGAVLATHGLVLYLMFRNDPGHVQASAAISLISSPAILLWIFGMAVLQGNHQFRALNVSRMIGPPITALLMMSFLAVGSHSLVLATLIWTALACLTAIITSFAVLRGLPKRTTEHKDRLPSFRSLANFSLKALLGSVTPLEGFQLDQAIVGIFLSQAALGVYVVAVAFTNLPRFVAQGIGLVGYPHVAAAREGHDTGRLMMRFMVTTLVLCGATVGLIEFGLPVLVPLLFGAPFHAAVGVARILLISALLFALRRVLSECARGAGRPGLGSVAEVISLATLFPAVAVLYHLGARGVALALVVAAFAGLAGMIVGLVGPSLWRQRRGVAVVARGASPSEVTAGPAAAELAQPASEWIRQ
jgi:O-antigen/teichoic acid export membrane protein